MSDSVAEKLSLGSILIHADDHEANPTSIAPPISVSTTFRHTEGLNASDLDVTNPSHSVYARYWTPNTVRVEKVLSEILNGRALVYASGLAAASAAIAHLKPKRVAITKGYMGMQHVLELYKRSKGDLVIVDLDDEFQEGDLAWVETPLNPTGEARDIQYYADKVHAVGGKLLVDSTFGPPPLQDPFTHGADVVFHSGTKYLGGHSDLLAGVLAVKSADEWKELWEDRIYLGSVLGSLESWLLLRSLRTLHLRVPRQSSSATELVQWLKGIASTPVGQALDGVPGGVVAHVYHSSLQGVKGNFDPAKQMVGGFSPTFSILLRDVETARKLPFSTKLFAPATSLGGVESLMEHRAGVDPNEDPLLVRISVGLEDVKDLKTDLANALKKAATTE